jgi:hypothetical protein
VFVVVVSAVVYFPYDLVRELLDTSLYISTGSVYTGNI